MRVHSGSLSAILVGFIALSTPPDAGAQRGGAADAQGGRGGAG